MMFGRASSAASSPELNGSDTTTAAKKKIFEKPIEGDIL
jgi:hypothetical protein